MQPTEHRFINFPLVMLSHTVPAPLRGLNRIASYAVDQHAERCRRPPYKALVQALYASRRQAADLPPAVSGIIARPDVSELADTALAECWEPQYGDFQSQALDCIAIDRVPLSRDEAAALVEWDSRRGATQFLGFTDCWHGTGPHDELDAHRQRFGALSFASVPADFFRDTLAEWCNEDAMRLFRLVCAVRSLGDKTFCGTTKDMIRYRMIGAKSQAVAISMMNDVAALKYEFEELRSRKRFDRLANLASQRGFLGKWGKGRRLYLSTKIHDPDRLAACVRADYDRRKRNVP